MANPGNGQPKSLAVQLSLDEFVVCSRCGQTKMRPTPQLRQYSLRPFQQLVSIHPCSAHAVASPAYVQRSSYQEQTLSSAVHGQTSLRKCQPTVSSFHVLLGKWQVKAMATRENGQPSSWPVESMTSKAMAVQGHGKSRPRTGQTMASPDHGQPSPCPLQRMDIPVNKHSRLWPVHSAARSRLDLVMVSQAKPVPGHMHSRRGQPRKWPIKVRPGDVSIAQGRQSILRHCNI
jgi:hypothetical protein